MTNVVGHVIRAAKFAGFLALALAAAGCANRQNDLGGGAGSAAPGSQQDFVVNVGDRVFFESDQTDLTPQAQATLEKQAQWLQQYNRYSFTIEGHADERGTREYNIALGARRAQEAFGYPVSDVAAKYGASAAKDTGNPEEAYGDWPGDFTPARVPWPPEP